MNSAKHYLQLTAASALGGAMALGGYLWLAPAGPASPKGIEAQQNVYLSRYDKEGSARYRVPANLDFVEAAARSTPAVVHVKTYYEGYAKEYGRYSMEDLLKDFFGDSSPEGLQDDMDKMATGSGVIISPDGYIATNNHVVDGATKVEVVLGNKRSYEAVVVGTDPNTDLALLKIQASDLPFLPYGDSDGVKVGQWVLAVGNPFDLTSTVTAGIVSAKGRNINILRSRSRLSIESFIQTDAAVNPGNSGGALVDLEGKLIGINTAIATNTGSYAGYSFAVPVALVKKVMADLQEFGEVKRAMLGVSIQDVDDALAKQLSLPQVSGVHISGIATDGAAAKAGLAPGDVITEIDGVPVPSVSELQELIGRKRPGEDVAVKYWRGGKPVEVTVQLKAQFGEEQLDYADAEAEEAGPLSIPEMGGVFESIGPDDRKRLGISEGVKVVKLSDGPLKSAGIREGFVITKIDKQPVGSPADLQEAVEALEGGLLLEGYNAKGEREFIGIGY